MFAEMGAEVVSADEAGHAVLEPGGAAYAAVARRWPDAVAGGRIDRSALAAIVFAEAAELRALEEMTHPHIRRLVESRVAEAARPVVMVEIPLIGDFLGPGWGRVVVDAPDEVRLSRLLEQGMERGDAERRMAAQPSRSRWLGAADLVVDNAGDLDHLAEECRLAWEWIAPV